MLRATPPGEDTTEPGLEVPRTAETSRLTTRSATTPPMHTIGTAGAGLDTQGRGRPGAAARMHRSASAAGAPALGAARWSPRSPDGGAPRRRWRPPRGRGRPPPAGPPP